MLALKEEEYITHQTLYPDHAHCSGDADTVSHCEEDADTVTHVYTCLTAGGSEGDGADLEDDGEELQGFVFSKLK